MLLLFGIFEWLFVIIISEKLKDKTSWSTHPDFILISKSGYKEASKCHDLLQLDAHSLFF